MIQVWLIRKLTNAANRNGDRVYALNCELPAVPRAGDKFALTMERGVEVDAVEFRPGFRYIRIYLHADHRNYKAGNKEKHFEESCLQYQEAGWLIPTKEFLT